MKKDEPTNPLDALAAQAATLDSAQDVPAEPSQEDQQAAQAMAMIESGMQSVVLALLKVGRAILAKRLPEIRDEWTDEALSAPAAAAVPLLRKHMETLMQLAGSSPEAAALAITCIPLAMGIVTAMEKADQREKADKLTKFEAPANAD